MDWKLPDGSDLCWTAPLEPQDGRLKVLWIEDDKQNKVLRGGALDDFRDWFSVFVVGGPDELKTLLALAERDEGRAGEGGGIYCRPASPFDIYLADFRLCDALPDCTLQHHLGAGLHAPSAGFLLSILTAMRWPQHPQGIIPYSGHDEEFGQIWRLARHLFPPGVQVTWREDLGKAGHGGPDKRLRLSAPMYRVVLGDALDKGLVHVPYGERERWEERLEDAGQTLDAREQMWFVGEYGARPFRLGALFFEHVENEVVPTDVVREWMATIPVADPVERQARDLAEFYWCISRDEISRMIYGIARQLALGVSVDVPDYDPPAIPRLDSRKQGGPDGIRRVRLAIIFVILREHAVRALGSDPRLPSQKQGLSREANQFRRKLLELQRQRPTGEDVAERFKEFAEEDGAREDYYDELMEEIADRFDREMDDPLSALQVGPIEEADIVQLIDPFPGTWRPGLTLARDKALGKALQRLCPEKDSAPFLLKELIEGDGSQITEVERLCASRYARELMPSQDDWPSWLGGKR